MPDKSNVILGLLAKNETTYGTPVALSSSTNGIQLASLPDLQLTPAFDGKRALPPGTSGNQRRMPPAGQTVEVDFAMEGKGAGAAYSSSVFPADLHPFLLACGMSVTTVSTGGSETQTYAPTAGGTSYSSLNYEAYPRGEKWTVDGVIGSWSMKSDGIGPVLFTFKTKGRRSANPTDVSCPTIVYAPTVIPPPAGAGVLTINSVATLKVRSWTFDMQREVTPCIDLNAANGHGGFAPGRRDPVFTAIVEWPALATLNPYALWGSATEIATTLRIGAVQYNKYLLSMPTGNVSLAKLSSDGQVATGEITIMPHPSLATNNDDFSLTFD